jgi:hypothetical protein
MIDTPESVVRQAIRSIAKRTWHVFPRTPGGTLLIFGEVLADGAFNARGGNEIIIGDALIGKMSSIFSMEPIGI